MIIKHGDLFTTDAECIGHGVNVDGVMGAGIAKAFREKFPGNYASYSFACRSKAFKPGMVRVVPEGDLLIFNMASQDRPGANAQYGWLFDAARTSAQIAWENGYDRIAIPQIGCGIGGLEWKQVRRCLLVTEIIVPEFEWEVWIYAD